MAEMNCYHVICILMTSSMDNVIDSLVLYTLETGSLTGFVANVCMICATEAFFQCWHSPFDDMLAYDAL